MTEILSAPEDNNSKEPPCKSCSGTYSCPPTPNSSIEGGSRIYNNLLHEKEGNSAWDYYQRLNLIGQGSISTIYEVVKKPQTSNRPFRFLCCGKNSVKQHHYALKMIDIRLVNDKHLEEMENEIAIFRDMDHPNIVKAYETFHYKQHISIVMELCSGGDLYTRAPYSEKEAAHIVDEVLSAVAYMHQNKIIHRDLKFENIMFESKDHDAKIKVIDFGLSTKYLDPEVEIKRRVGTIYTMAPEVIRQVPYDYKADLFSVGVISYMLITNSRPFWGKTKEQVKNEVKRCQPNMATSSKVWQNKSNDANNFVSKLLTKSPDERMSCQEAKDHPWLSHMHDLPDRNPPQSTMSNVEQSLIRFADSGEFRRLILNVLAHQTTTAEIKQLSKAFDAYDLDNNGFITYSEFKEALSHLNMSDFALDKMFHSVDINKNGHIMYNEFIAATLEAQNRIEEEKLRDAFDRLDADETGYISKKNLCSFLGGQCYDDYVDRLIQEADLAGDGQISYKEFITAFRQQKKFFLRAKIGLSD